MSKKNMDELGELLDEFHAFMNLRFIGRSEEIKICGTLGSFFDLTPEDFKVQRNYSCGQLYIPKVIVVFAGWRSKASEGLEMFDIVSDPQGVVWRLNCRDLSTHKESHSLTGSLSEVLEAARKFVNDSDLFYETIGFDE